jgi:hypothetical protein
MSKNILKMFPKPLNASANNNLFLKSHTLSSIIIHDTYNHFKLLNESNFTEEKYKTLNDVHKHFFKFAPKTDFYYNYKEEIDIIGYSLKEFKVETLPGILFSKNFEILALKNENVTMDENITQLILIDIEKLKKENQDFIVKCDGRYLS